MSIPNGYYVSKYSQDTFSKKIQQLSSDIATKPQVYNAIANAIGGMSADDISNPYIEGGVYVPRTYLDKPGYIQTLAECADGNTQPIEIYEWIYRRLYIADRVSSVEVNGEEIPTTFTANDVEYLRIEVSQFDGVTEDNFRDITTGDDTLMHYYYRVEQDNPELLNVVQVIRYWYSTTTKKLKYLGVPLIKYEEIQKMRQVCRETRNKIADKIYSLYKIQPGDSLTKGEKLQVSKVIHDWLVLNNEYDDTYGTDESSSPITSSLMYPALSMGAINPICTSYSLAYQWLTYQYGIESLIMTGKVYKTASDGTYKGYGHMWNMVNFEEDIGEFSTGDDNWTMVDVTYDDPLGTSESYIRWTYMHFPWNQLPASGEHGYRVLDRRAYIYPTENPLKFYLYSGSTPYVWE